MGEGSQVVDLGENIRLWQLGHDAHPPSLDPFVGSQDEHAICIVEFNRPGRRFRRLAEYRMLLHRDGVRRCGIALELDQDIRGEQGVGFAYARRGTLLVVPRSICMLSKAHPIGSRS